MNGSAYVYLCRDELVQKGACSGGLACFDAIAALRGKRRKIRIEWNQLAWCWLNSNGQGFASWLYGQGLAPMPSFARANLAGANLAGAYLVGANLARANLARANLAGANLARANLAGANLAGANLARANLAGANLAGAYLAGAYLAGANLAGANLAGAYLAGAYLAGAYRRNDPPAGWEPDRFGYLRRREARAEAAAERSRGVL